MAIQRRAVETVACCGIAGFIALHNPVATACERAVIRAIVVVDVVAVIAVFAGIQHAVAADRAVVATLVAAGTRRGTRRKGE